MIKSLAEILRQLDGVDQICGCVNCVGVDCTECPFNTSTSLAQAIEKLEEVADE